jgi:hypothetical protein
MKLNDLDHWNIAAMRAAASRERAQALHELGARLAAWVRSTLVAGAPRARRRECLDGGR